MDSEIKEVVEYATTSDVNDKLKNPEWVYLGIRNGFYVVGRREKSQKRDSFFPGALIETPNGG